MKSKNIRKVLSMILSLSLMLQLGMPALYAQEPTVITEFKALEVTEITVPAGTSKEGVLEKLPTTLRVTTPGAIGVDFILENVTWENEVYSSTAKDAEFAFTAKLGDGSYTLETGVDLPVITVRIGAPEGMTLTPGAVYGGDITNGGLNLFNNIPEKMTQYKAGQGYVLFTPDEEGAHRLELNHATILPDENQQAITLEGDFTLDIIGDNKIGGIYASKSTLSIEGSGKLSVSGRGIEALMFSTLSYGKDVTLNLIAYVIDKDEIQRYDVFGDITATNIDGENLTIHDGASLTIQAPSGGEGASNMIRGHTIIGKGANLIINEGARLYFHAAEGNPYHVENKGGGSSC